MRRSNEFLRLLFLLHHINSQDHSVGNHYNEAVSIGEKHKLNRVTRRCFLVVVIAIQISRKLHASLARKVAATLVHV